MINKDILPDALMYACYECTKWVPVKEAVPVKAEGRLHHFCGQPCIEKWSTQEEKTTCDSNSNISQA